MADGIIGCDARITGKVQPHEGETMEISSTTPVNVLPPAEPLQPSNRLPAAQQQSGDTRVQSAEGASATETTTTQATAPVEQGEAPSPDSDERVGTLIDARA